MERTRAIPGIQQSAVSTNKVLRDTYRLLSATLLFSAIAAGAAMALNVPPLNPLLVLVGYFGLLFGVNATRNSGTGVLMVFALTGFMGFTLGPILSLYMQALPNGSQVVMTALGTTGLAFLGISAFAIRSGKDFSHIGNFLFIGILTAFVLGLVAFFFSMPMLSLAVSAMFVLLASGLILWQTSEIVHGGETNYLMATVTLYVSIYNLFTSLLHLLGVFGDE